MFYKMISFKYVGVCYIVSIEVLLCLYYSVIIIYNFFINKSISIVMLFYSSFSILLGLVEIVVMQSIRDALTLAYAGNYISDAEFVLLYEYNRWKPVFPYWKFNAFNLET